MSLCDVKKYSTFINLFLGYGLVQLLLHTFYLLNANDPKIILPTAIALIHDFFILLLYSHFSIGIIRLIPEKYYTYIKNILVVGFILLGTILSLYPKMLREYLIFPSNMFESDVSSAQTLIVEYLGISSLITQLFVIIFGIIIGFVIKWEFKLNKFSVIIFTCLIFLLTILSLKQNSPQPFLYSMQTQIESIIKNEKRVVQSIKVGKKENSNLIYPIKYPDGEIAQYKHVLMVVLEGVTAKNFENEFMTISNGFYAHYINKSNYFNNYYSTNLDSYTSLIAMISGIHVPYRSYSDVELYENVNKELNLVDYFNKQGFNSLFVSTFEYQPFIPSFKFWKNIYTRNDFDVTKYVTIGSSRMEKASEDKVAIDKIVEYMKENKRTFMMHELAYGHSPEWRASMGISQLKYYDDYLLEITEKLKKTVFLMKLCMLLYLIMAIGQ